MYGAVANSRRWTTLADARSSPGTFAIAAKGEYAPPLKELLRVIRRRVWVIALVIVVLGGGRLQPHTDTSVRGVHRNLGRRRARYHTEVPSDVISSLQLTQSVAEG